MQQAEKPKFAQLVTDVLAFYRQDTSPFALQVWWSACERFDFEQVSKALTQHAMDPDRGQFAPKPADMVRMLQGTSTDKAMLAWGKCLSAMERVGAYTDVVFDDPAIHAAAAGLPAGGPVHSKRLQRQCDRLDSRWSPIRLNAPSGANWKSTTRTPHGAPHD